MAQFQFGAIKELANLQQLGYLQTTEILHICDQHIKVHHNIKKKRKFVPRFHFNQITYHLIY